MMSQTHKTLLIALYLTEQEVLSLTIYKLICLKTVERDAYNGNPDALGKRDRTFSGPDVEACFTQEGKQ